MTTENVVCTFCGCLCDDLKVDVKDDGTVEVKGACANGKGHIEAYDPSEIQPRVMGKPVSWDEAFKKAASILGKAGSPLFYGLSSTATEAQRKCVALADALGAVVDTTSSVCHGPTGIAMQNWGEPTCSLGEVLNRADFLLFWGCNPAVAHSRHFVRYSLTPKGRYVPGGRKDRTIVLVDIRDTPSSKAADVFLKIRQGSDYEVLTALRALVQGKKLDATEVGGLDRTQLDDLAERMKAARYGVAFFGMGLTMTSGRDLNVGQYFSLVRDLNAFTRFSVVAMRGHGNVAGADAVLTWQTGYPFAVSLAGGVPRYGPGEFTAVDMLARREADAALIVASDPVAHFPGAAARALAEMPTVVIDPVESLTASEATVFLPGAQYGADAEGTYYRMDGVPVRAKAFLRRRRPTDEEIFDRLLKEVVR